MLRYQITTGVGLLLGLGSCEFPDELSANHARIALSAGGNTSGWSWSSESCDGLDFDGDGFDDLSIGAPGEDSSRGVVHRLWGHDVFASWRWNVDDYRVYSNDWDYGEQFGFSQTHGDFDGDGYDDLAIGAPTADAAGRAGAGTVEVFHGGSSARVSAGFAGIWHQNSPGVRGGAETGDDFGAALAAGDFDGDGYDDLVVGAPGENTSGSTGGAVHALYGGSSGISGAGDQFFVAYNSGFPDGGYMGEALAAGDFDGDGYDDLAIGVPWLNYDGSSYLPTAAGGVYLRYGSSSGLVTKWWDPVLTRGAPESGAEFGAALVVADFNLDGYDDLAVGVPHEDNGGGVEITYGSQWGLGNWSPSYGYPARRLLTQANTPYTSDETGDNFGRTLAAGDINGDGFPDLLVGAPFEDIGSAPDRGMIHAFLGGNDGVAGSTTISKYFGLGLPDYGSGDRRERLGAALSVGDFNDDGYCDVVAGAPYFDFGSAAQGGAVFLLYGASSPWTSTDFLMQSTSGIAGASETNDLFGASLR